MVHLNKTYYINYNKYILYKAFWFLLPHSSQSVFDTVWPSPEPAVENISTHEIERKNAFAVTCL